ADVERLEVRSGDLCVPEGTALGPGIHHTAETKTGKPVEEGGARDGQCIVSGSGFCRGRVPAVGAELRRGAERAAFAGEAVSGTAAAVCAAAGCGGSGMRNRALAGNLEGERAAQFIRT